MKLTSGNINDLETVANAIIQNTYNRKIILLNGEMGVGKTTLVKEIAKLLGVEENVSSPTFSIVNEYHGNEVIFHFDFYRLKNEQEAYDMGYENYFYSNHYCFIEWPEKITNLLPEKLLRIHIESEANMRIFTIEEIKS